ncbi:hypothetical protein Pcinc_028559, partial [Petrolisthes cinctipes]
QLEELQQQQKLLVWSRIRKIAGKHTPPMAPILHTDVKTVGDTRQVAEILGRHSAKLARVLIFHLCFNH